MRSVNSLIEMALDFGEFDVDDPYDPEFHKAVAGQRVVVYYGTTSDKFWDVVKNGINVGPTIKQAREGDNELSFSTTVAKDRASYLAYLANHEQSDGPIKPIMFTVETQFQKPHEAGKGEMGQMLGQAFGAEANTVLPTHIKPINIVGVVYPAKANTWEVPIKKFIQRVNSGLVDGIEPDRTFKRGKYRPYGPTPEAWQHVIIRYVNDMLNYSSNLYDYLLAGRTEKALNDMIVREATKTGLGRMMNWTGREMMQWVYSFIPPQKDWDKTPEEDIEGIMNGSDRTSSGRNLWDYPLYQLMKKYGDETTWKYRSGKEEPPTPHDEGGLD